MVKVVGLSANKFNYVTTHHHFCNFIYQLVRDKNLPFVIFCELLTDLEQILNIPVLLYYVGPIF